MKKRSLFLTKTAALQYFVMSLGVIAVLAPDLGIQEFIASNMPVITSALGVVGLLLRKVTQGKVVLWNK